MKELFPIEADNLPIEVKQGTKNFGCAAPAARPA